MMIRSILPLSLFLAAASVAAMATGCADQKAATPQPVTPTSLAHPAPVETTSAMALPSAAALETPGLRVSDEIARACNLPKQEYSPTFDYDSNAIVDQDRVVLSALARCLSDGALRGRGIALTGRADPRGEPEYNMSLGEARADSVRRYMHDLGVQQDRLRATSRGEIDATGTDEPGWAHDRRVDIELAN